MDLDMKFEFPQPFDVLHLHGCLGVCCAGRTSTLEADLGLCRLCRRIARQSAL